MGAIRAARCVFADVWKLYVKYAVTPHVGHTGDPNLYWHNLAVEADRVAQRWPCALTEALVQAVIEEHARRDLNAQEGE